MEKPNPIIPDNPIITLFVVSEGEGNNLWIPYPANPPRRPKGSSYKRYAQANKPTVAATAVISNKAKIELPTMPLIIKLFIVLSLPEAIGVFCYFFHLSLLYSSMESKHILYREISQSSWQSLSKIIIHRSMYLLSVQYS